MNEKFLHSRDNRFWLNEVVESQIKYYRAQRECNRNPILQCKQINFLDKVDKSFLNYYIKVMQKDNLSELELNLLWNLAYYFYHHLQAQKEEPEEVKEMLCKKIVSNKKSS